jgi:hypothetical protein
LGLFYNSHNLISYYFTINIQRPRLARC